MDKERLKVHIRLCRRNLKCARVKCCATCPFEKEIIEEYSEIKVLFENKRRILVERGDI